jgi:hypothetical protein
MRQFFLWFMRNDAVSTITREAYTELNMFLNNSSELPESPEKRGHFENG